MLEQLHQAIAARRAELVEQLEALDRAEADLGIAFGITIAPASPVERDHRPVEEPERVPGASTGQETACAECGEAFVPRRAWARYCSPGCRARAAAQRRQAKETPDDRPAPAAPEDPNELPDDPVLDPERPLHVPDKEAAWLTELLQPPAAGPWDRL